MKKTVVRERFLGLTIGIATRLVEEGVATAEATDRGATVGLRRRWGPFAQLSTVGVPEGLRLVEQYAHRWPGNFPVSKELRERAARGERTWPLSCVRVQREGPVAWVLLDRPEAMNALNSEMFDQLEEAFSALESEHGVRVVVLAGSSPVFAAGADIAEMERKSLAEGVAFGFQGQRVADRIEHFPTPVIALVEGYALGGGLEIALAADFIVAAEGSLLGLPEVTVGIHPGLGGATRLTRLIGRAKTKLLTYSGVPVSAEEAYRLGFVVKVVPAASARAGRRGDGRDHRKPSAARRAMGEAGDRPGDGRPARDRPPSRGRIGRPHVRHRGPSGGDASVPRTPQARVQGPVDGRRATPTQRKRGTRPRSIVPLRGSGRKVEVGRSNPSRTDPG